MGQNLSGRALALGGALSMMASLAHAQASTEHYTYDALGRLVIARTSGGQNNGEARSICFDSADNRASYTARSNGTAADCVDVGEAGSTTPDPDPTNSPPVANIDYTDGPCLEYFNVNVIANDTDPESNYPLELVSVTKVSGNATATKLSSTTVRVRFGGQWDVSSFTYVVRDSLGAVAVGTLGASSSTCNRIEP